MDSLHLTKYPGANQRSVCAGERRKERADMKFSPQVETKWSELLPTRASIASGYTPDTFRALPHTPDSKE